MYLTRLPNKVEKGLTVMDTNDTRLALSDVQGPLIDLLEKVGGRDGELWLRGLNKFLRKENPWEKPEIWKTVETGTHKDVKTLCAALETSGVSTGNWATDILGKIRLAKTKQVLDLVVMSVKELGFSEGAQYQDITKAASERNLEKCSAEAAACFLLQHGSEIEPYGILNCAMDPIKDSDGDLGLFHVRRSGGRLWLDAGYGGPDGFWSSDDRFVFVRSK